MRKWLLLLALLLLPTFAYAQSTTVSGQVIDSSSQQWFVGSYQFTFQPAPFNPAGPYKWNGQPFNTNQVIFGSLDSTGSYSVSVPSNSSIVPSGSSWNLQVCPAATPASCYTQNVVVTGSTQTVNPVPPAITVTVISPQPRIVAYSLTELSGGLIGSTALILTTATTGQQYQCITLPCGWQTVGGGGSGSLPSTAVGFGNSLNILTGDPTNFFYNSGNFLLTANGGFNSTSSVPWTGSSGSNVAIKPPPAGAIEYVSNSGNDSNDGLSLGTAKATISGAVSALPSVNGYTHAGTVDASQLNNVTFTSEVDIGDSAADQRYTLILPPAGSWQFNITDGVSCGIKQFNGTRIIGSDLGNAAGRFVLQPSSSSVDMRALYCTNPSSTGQYIRAEGFTVNNDVGATMAIAAFEAAHFFDESRFENIAVFTEKGVGAQIYDACCESSFNHFTVNGNSASGVQPAILGNSTLGGSVDSGGLYRVNFDDNSITHPGAGKYDIEIGGGLNTGGVTFNGIYMEPNATDTSTSAMELDANVYDITLNGYTLSNTASGSVAYAVGIASWSGPTEDVFLGGKSQTKNLVSDAVTGDSVLGDSGTYGQRSLYISGEPYFSSIGLLSSTGGIITHIAPSTASNFTITDPAVTGNGFVYTGSWISGDCPIAQSTIGQVTWGSCGGSGGNPLWNNIQSPNGNMLISLGTYTTTFDFSSSSNYFNWANVTSATSGANQSSPYFYLSGQYWNGSASAGAGWSEQDVFGLGPNPTNTLTFLATGADTGTAAVSVPSLLSAGSVTGSSFVCTGSGSGCSTWTLGNGSQSAASYFFAYSGSGASNTTPAYLELGASPSNAFYTFLYPCLTYGNLCLASSTPSADSSRTIAVHGGYNPQSGTTYTISTNDEDGLTNGTGTASATWTLPCPSGTSFPQGWADTLIQGNTGSVTVSTSGCNILVNGAAGTSLTVPTTGVKITSTGSATGTAFVATFNGSGSGSGVSSLTCDGIVETCSPTTGAVTLVLGTAGAYKVLMNNTGSTATPTYASLTLASAQFANQGTTSQVLIGNASGNPSWGTLPCGAMPTFTGDVTNSSCAMTVGQVEGAAIPTSATVVATNSSKQLIAASLASADIWVGNSSNLPVAVTPSGDWTMTNAGVDTVASVHGVSYPASPSTTTVPVVTASNTVTYENLPINYLGNPTASQSFTMGNDTLDFNFGAAIGSSTAFYLSDSSSDTGTGGVLGARTAATSSNIAAIFEATAASNGTFTNPYVLLLGNLTAATSSQNQPSPEFGICGNAWEESTPGNFQDCATLQLTYTSGSNPTGLITLARSNPGTNTALTLVLPASSTNGAPFNIPQGTAPTSPNNGDIWTTSSGVFARIAGSTVGPFGSGGSSPYPLMGSTTNCGGTGSAYMGFPIGLGGCSASSDVTSGSTPMPTGGTASYFHLWMSVAPGSGITITYTVYDNTTAQSITCTVSGASATTCSDTTHSFTFAQGDLLTVLWSDSGGTAATATVTYSLRVTGAS